MRDVVVYTTPTCAYCHFVVRLLRQKGVPFRQVDVRGDAEKRRWLAEVTGRTTVPQVFIEGQPYGGYTDLAALDAEGRLDALLGLAEEAI